MPPPLCSLHVATHTWLQLGCTVALQKHGLVCSFGLSTTKSDRRICNMDEMHFKLLVSIGSITQHSKTKLLRDLPRLKMML